MSRLWGSCRSKRKARWHLKYQREKPDDIWNITQKHFLEICKLPKWSWQQWFSIFHAIMVDCPTRWSPWYWYLEFYVDRYPDDQEILYSLSSLLFRLLNVLLILSWKSFHWRHSFSDILKWRFRKSKIWITMEETASPSSRFSPKWWKVKFFPSSSLIRFIYAIILYLTKQETREPYFLFLSYPAVHDPLAAPERHLQMCNHVKNYRRRWRDKE